MRKKVYDTDVGDGAWALIERQREDQVFLLDHLQGHTDLMQGLHVLTC